MTHWKKLQNPDYLGAYALTPGQDLIATIKSVGAEMVTGTDGKKEECTVVRFVERNIKPMILNATNAKTITKLFKTPYIEQWANRKIQIYIADVKAFGETVQALRIRSFLPKVQSQEILCFDCKKPVQAAGNMNVQQTAEYTQKKYGRILCAECATKEAEKMKGSDIL